jgi:hypothetical protein
MRSERRKRGSGSCLKQLSKKFEVLGIGSGLPVGVGDLTIV